MILPLSVWGSLRSLGMFRYTSSFVAISHQTHPFSSFTSHSSLNKKYNLFVRNPCLVQTYAALSKSLLDDSVPLFTIKSPWTFSQHSQSKLKERFLKDKVGVCHFSTSSSYSRKNLTASRKPRKYALHDSQWEDEYAWMQDQEGPLQKRNGVNYLEMENRYYNNYFRGKSAQWEWTKEIQLHQEMEDNSSPEIKDMGKHMYYPSISKTGSTTFCRRSKETGDVQVLLDTADLEERFDYLEPVITAFKFSPCQSYLGAVVECSLGRCDGHIIRMDGNSEQAGIVDTISDIFNLEFSGDDCMLYTKSVKGQPRQVWCHQISSSSDTDKLVFHEEDEKFSVDISTTKDRRYIVINSNSRTTSELWLCDCRQLPSAPPYLLWPRQEGVECYVDHCSDSFYALTTSGHPSELKLLRANDESDFRSQDAWKEVYVPPAGCVIQDMDVFSSQCVLCVMEDTVPCLAVVLHSNQGKPCHIKLPPAYTNLVPSFNADLNSMTYHFQLSSPIHPSKNFELNLQTFEITCPGDQENGECGDSSKDQELGSSTGSEVEGCKDQGTRFRQGSGDQGEEDIESRYRPDEFECQRLLAPSKDGTAVPVTVFHKKSLSLDSTNPMLVMGYGAYGRNVDMGFKGEQMALLSRGWVLAFCHVRGGGELGREWYHAGRLGNKNRSFEDFESCIEFLHSAGFSQPSLTAGWGASAGGLLLGVLCNRRPDLIRAAVMRMPFVDVRSSMLDPLSSLTSQDYEEWGDPRVSSSAFHDISSYCPYTNIKSQKYPSILVTTSLEDSIVPHWGPLKYVARLRDHTCDRPDCIILLKVFRRGGHFALDESDADTKQATQEWTFLHNELGLLQ